MAILERTPSLSGYRACGLSSVTEVTPAGLVPDYETNPGLVPNWTTLSLPCVRCRSYQLKPGASLAGLQFCHLIQCPRGWFTVVDGDHRGSFALIQVGQNRG